jgi:hypothetical protein
LKGLPESVHVLLLQRPELSQDQDLFDRREDRLDRGGLQESRVAPLLDQHVSKSRGGPGGPACDCDDDDIWTFAMRGVRTDDDAGRLFEAVWFVKGNGTRTTSPNLEPIVFGIVRIIPDLAEGVL